MEYKIITSIIILQLVYIKSFQFELLNEIANEINSIFNF